MFATKNSPIQLNENIQVFRGLAIIAVVVIHTIPLGMWQVFCRPFVNYAVATFIFLSGYLTHEKENYYPIIKKRVIRVLIPYIIWSIVYDFQLLKEGEYLSFLIRLLTAQTCFPFYYIFVYIQLVILTPLIFKLAKSRWRIIGWFISPIYIIVTLYLPRLSIIQINPYISIICSDLCFGWFCFYYLGLFLGNKTLLNNKSTLFNSVIRPSRDKIVFFNKKLLLLYVLSIAFEIVEIYYWYRCGIVNCGSQGNLTAILSNMILLLIIYELISRNVKIVGSKWLIPIGNYSFGIYLCHVLVINSLIGIAFYQFLPPLVNSAVIVALSLLICYVLSKLLGSKYTHILGVE